MTRAPSKKTNIPTSLKTLIDKYENSDSIRQRAEYQSLIEVVISKIAEQLDSWDKHTSSWYFPDAEEGEVGTVESALMENDLIEIIVHTGRIKEYRYINLNTLEVD